MIAKSKSPVWRHPRGNRFRFRRWEPTAGTFPAWAATVARNLAVDYLRRQHEAVSLLGPEAAAIDTVSLDAFAAIEDAAMIASLYERLRRHDDTQALKVMTALRDLVAHGRPVSQAAVAAEAQLSESTVRRALVRVRAVANELGREM